MVQEGMNRRPAWSRMAALAALLSAQPYGVAAAQEAATLSVGASGYAARVPDRAWIRFTAATQAKTPVEAIDANANVIKDLLDRLRAKGIAGKNLQTAALALQPKHEVKREGGREIRGDLIGYVASKSVTAIIEDVGVVSSYIREFPLAGVLRIADVGFFSTEVEAAQSDALVDAIKRAQKAGQTAVTAAGRELGPVSMIEVVIPADRRRPPYFEDRERGWQPQQSEGELGPRLLAEPGEQQFDQSVKLQWQLR
jgi:uncharacterized protein YggE